MVKAFKNFCLEAKRIYLQNQSKYVRCASFLHLSAATILCLRALCALHTIQTLVGVRFIPYSRSFRLSLAWVTGSAFFAGIVLCQYALDLIKK